MKKPARNILKSATLRQLQAFERVAKTGNFTAAAEELFLTQPTVSMQMKKLSEDVGIPLLEQVGRKILLTEAGEALLKTCESIFQNLDQFNEKLSGLKQLHGGNLKVAGVTTTEYFVPLMLGVFNQRHPDIDVSLKIFNRESLLESLRNYTEEIYIVDQLVDIHHVEIIPFIRNPLVVIVPPNHPFVCNSNINMNELIEEDFLVREPESGTRKAFEKFIKRKQVAIKRKIELTSNEALKRAVMGGLGISVLSEHAVMAEISTGRLAKLNVEDFPLEEQWYILFPKNKKLSSVGHDFVEFLNKEGKPFIDAFLNCKELQLCN